MRLVLTLLLLASPAAAQEVLGGIFAHNVDLPTSIGSPEGGANGQVGLRTAPFGSIGKGDLRGQLFGSVNFSGGLNFVAANVLARFPLGSRAYFQPGVGLAVHDGPGGTVDQKDGRLYLGSRVTAALELGLGFRLGRRTSLEASWVHISHAQIASGQNPGLDNLGVRFVLGF